MLRDLKSLLYIFPVIALLAPAMSGCDDDPVSPGASATVVVEVIDVQTGDPEPGVKLMLLDPVANLPATAVAISDTAGGAVFNDVPQGEYVLLALPRQGRQLFSSPGLVSAAVPGRDPAIPAINIVRTMSARSQPGGGNSISGVVRDAETGLPLDSVFLGSRDDWLGAYLGWNPTKADITDSSGVFMVPGIAFALNPNTNLLLQVEPLIAQRAGYRPLEWFADGRRINSGIITGVSLDLVPLEADGSETGGAFGVVSFLGEPVAGVRVGLSFWGAYAPPPGFSSDSGNEPAAPGGYAVTGAGAGAPGRVTLTDAEGRYEFTDLKPGWYLVHAAYPAGDGFVMPQPLGPGNTPNGINPLPVEVVADATAEAADIAVFRAIRLLAPAAGAIGVSSQPQLRWSSVPEAASYSLSLDNRFFEDIPDTSFSVPSGSALDAGPWTVLLAAYDLDGLPVGVIETATRFVVGEGF